MQVITPLNFQNSHHSVPWFMAIIIIIFIPVLIYTGNVPSPPPCRLVPHFNTHANVLSALQGGSLLYFTG